MDLKKYIRDVEDFPKKGILFRDISPLLANGVAMNEAINQLEKYCLDADVIVGPDARGFIFGTPISSRLKKPFVMVRKPGKLPGKIIQKHYDLEYGSNTLEIQEGMIEPGQEVVIIDDLMATGGTTNAIVQLLKDAGAIVKRVVVLIELEDLKGKDKLPEDVEFISLLKY